MQFSRCSALALAAQTDFSADSCYLSILTERLSDIEVEHGGDKGSRTPDLLLARQALSQLSYAPGIQGRALKIE